MKFEGYNSTPDAMMKSKGAVKCFERVIAGMNVDETGAVAFEGAALVSEGGGRVESTMIGAEVK